MVNTLYISIIITLIIILVLVFEYMRTKCNRYKASAMRAKNDYAKLNKNAKELKMHLDHLNALIGNDKSGYEMYVYPQLYIVDYYSQKIYRVDNYQLPNSSIAFGTTDRKIWDLDDAKGTASINIDPKKFDTMVNNK